MTMSPAQPKVKTFVRIKIGTIKRLLEGYDRRRVDPKDPCHRYTMPTDETVIEFNDSCCDGPRKDSDGSMNYGSNIFGCYDDKTDTLSIQ
jgi:hypothetical protein